MSHCEIYRGSANDSLQEKVGHQKRAEVNKKSRKRSAGDVEKEKEELEEMYFGKST